MDGEALISHDVLASYAADAALEVPGVRGLVDGHLPGRRGVRVAVDEGRVAVEVHLCVDWGASVPDVGSSVQRRIADYLARMADIRSASVEVVVDEIGTPS